MSRFLIGHLGPFHFWCLLVLFSRIMPEVLAKCKHRNKTQSADLSPPFNDSRSDKIVHQNRSTDASVNASSYPALRWLDVEGAGNVNVTPTARKSSGRSFNDAKTRLDEMEDKIALRSFFPYGSRQRFPGAVVRADNYVPAIRPLQGDSYVSAPKPSLAGQQTNLGNQISASGDHHGTIHGSRHAKVCAMKMLDLGNDVCGFVNHLVQLGKLLERRNLLLSIMAKEKINSGEAAPQTLSSFVVRVIEDLTESNTKMEEAIDNRNFDSQLKEPRDELPKPSSGSQISNETTEIIEISTVKSETTTTREFLNETLTTLKNEPANRSSFDDFAIDKKNKITEPFVDKGSGDIKIGDVSSTQINNSTTSAA